MENTAMIFHATLVHPVAQVVPATIQKLQIVIFRREQAEQMPPANGNIHKIVITAIDTYHKDLLPLFVIAGRHRTFLRPQFPSFGWVPQGGGVVR